MRKTALFGAAAIVAGVCAAALGWAAQDGPIAAAAATREQGDARPAVGPNETARSFIISCKLLAEGPDGKTRVLSEPTLVTVEGRPATIRVGQDVKIEGPARATRLFAGMRLDVTVEGTADGSITLDAAIEKSWQTGEPTKAGVRVASVGMHVVEPITLGRRVVVPFFDETAVGADNMRFEVVVSESSPKGCN